MNPYGIEKQQHKMSKKIVMLVQKNYSNSSHKL